MQGTEEEPEPRDDQKGLRGFLAFVVLIATIFAGSLMAAVSEGDAWRALISIGLMAQAAIPVYIIQKIRAIKS